MITPAALNTREYLEARESSLKYGVTNCRPIADSTVWSQHAWSNALDITSSEGVTTLNRVAKLLEANKEMLAIRVLLWWRKDHYTHIHVDFWPKGYSDPPCSGGKLIVAYKDGSMGDKFTYNQTDNTKRNEMLKEGDKGVAVSWFQLMLVRANYRPNPGEADGIYGPKTKASVIGFQRAWDIQQSGAIGDITAATLASYSKRYSGTGSKLQALLDGDSVKLTKIT